MSYKNGQTVYKSTSGEKKHAILTNWILKKLTKFRGRYCQLHFLECLNSDKNCVLLRTLSNWHRAGIVTGNNVENDPWRHIAMLCHNDFTSNREEYLKTRRKDYLRQIRTAVPSTKSSWMTQESLRKSHGDQFQYLCHAIMIIIDNSVSIVLIGVSSKPSTIRHDVITWECFRHY